VITLCKFEYFFPPTLNKVMWDTNIYSQKLCVKCNQIQRDFTGEEAERLVWKSSDWLNRVICMMTLQHKDKSSQLELFSFKNRKWTWFQSLIHSFLQPQSNPEAKSAWGWENCQLFLPPFLPSSFQLLFNFFIDPMKMSRKLTPHWLNQMCISLIWLRLITRCNKLLN